jgi:hypothetical protein
VFWCSLNSHFEELSTLHNFMELFSEYHLFGVSPFMALAACPLILTPSLKVSPLCEHDNRSRI